MQTNCKQVAVGCSYTSAVGVEPEQAYPELMGYANWAKPGTDIEYSLWCAHRAVDQGATHILFQITSWDRITLNTSNTHNFAQNRPWTDKNEYDHYTIADYVQDSNHIKWIYEHHVMSNWRTENLAQRIVELRAYAHSHACAIEFYDWLPRYTIPIHPSLEPLLPSASVLDWLGDGYYADSYYHVNATAHQRIAEEYFK
jgi:hypothetical protein